jgi:hypothetical protein
MDIAGAIKSGFNFLTIWKSKQKESLEIKNYKRMQKAIRIADQIVIKVLERGIKDRVISELIEDYNKYNN